jgi:hypothetical protein
MLELNAGTPTSAAVPIAIHSIIRGDKACKT